MKTSYKKDAVKGVKWTTISTIITAAGNFLLILALTKFLTKTDFGLYALVTVVISFSSEFVDLGFGQAIIQKKTVSKNQLSSLYWINISLGILIFCIVFFSSGLISRFYENNELSPLLKWASIGFILMALGAQYQSLFQREMQFKKIAFIEIAAFLCSVVGIVIFVYYEHGVYALVWGSLIRTAIKSLASILLGIKNHFPNFYFKYSEIEDFVNFGFYRTGAFLLSFLGSQLDSILIGKFIGVSELGIYDIMKRLALYPVKLLNPVISKVTYPLLSRVHHDSVRSNSMFKKILKLLNFVRFPIFLAIAFMAKDITALLGDSWKDDYLLLQILVFVYLFNTIQSFVGQSMIAKGKANWALYNNMVQLPLGLIAIYIGSFWGIYGIAIALLVKALFIIVPRYFFLIRPLYDIRLKEYLSIIFKELFVLLILLGPFYFIINGLALSLYIDIIIRGLLFVLIVGVIYKIFKKEEIKYLLISTKPSATNKKT